MLGESIIEGVGAALMMPATASLVVANFSGKDRATAFGIWGAAAGASSAIGPLLGGFLTSHYSWRWGFRINLVIAALVVIGSLLFIRESKDERKPSLDWWGILLSSLGLLGITFAIVESSSVGWWHAKKALEIFGHNINFGNISFVPFALIFGVLTLIGFVFLELKRESQGKTPLVSMSIFKNQQFTSGVATISILTLSMSGMFFALPVFLQTVKKLDAFDTGLALLPLSLAILVFAPIVGNLSKKIQPRYFIQIGLIINIIGAFLVSLAISPTASVSHLIFPLVVYGIGMAFVFAPISNLILSAVPVQMSGEASGVNNTLRQVGSTLGAAIIGAVVLTSLSSYLVKAINHSTIIPDSSKQQIINIASDPNSNIEFSVASAIPKDASLAVKEEIIRLVNSSSARAVKDAYIYSALFAFIGFIISLFLPKRNIAEQPLTESEQKDSHSKNKILLSVLAMLLAVIGTVFWLNHNANKIVSTDLTSSDAIRQIFAPILNQSPSGSFGLGQTPTPTDQQTGLMTEPSPTPTEIIINAPTLVATSTNINPTSTPTPTPEPEAYENQALGFSMDIPYGWQSNVGNDGHTVIFTNANNQSVSIQSYELTNETLETIKEQLSGSSSVSNLKQTSYLNEPALSFKVINGNQAGIAVIHNNKIYYIIAPSLITPPVSSFKFR